MDQVKAFVSGRWAHEHALGPARQPQQLRTSLWAEKRRSLSKENGFMQIRIGWDDNSKSTPPQACTWLWSPVAGRMWMNHLWSLVPGDTQSQHRPSEFTTSHRSGCSKYFSQCLFCFTGPLLRFPFWSLHSCVPLTSQTYSFSKCGHWKHWFPSWFSKKGRQLFRERYYLECLWGICFWVVLSFPCRSPHTCVLRGIFS